MFLCLAVAQCGEHLHYGYPVPRPQFFAFVASMNTEANTEAMPTDSTQKMKLEVLEEAKKEIADKVKGGYRSNIWEYWASRCSPLASPPTLALFRNQSLLLLATVAQD